MRRPAQDVQARGVGGGVVIGTVRNLYERIPRKWRLRLILWGASFLFGFIVSRIWGVGTLLVVLIVVYVIAALLRNFGLAQWARGQFLGHIRGMIIFAILPVVWVIAKDFTKNPSMSSALVLILVLLLVMVIWERFERIQKSKGN